MSPESFSLHAPMSTLEIDGMDESTELERGEDLDIVIAGGGLAGLALALALQQRNIEAHVFETHPYFRSDTATAIGIGPNGVTALEGINTGLSSMMAEAGTYINSIKFAMVREGKEDPPGVMEMSPKEYVSVRWKSVHEILANLVDKRKIHFSHKFIAYRRCEGGVEAYFKCRKDGEDSLDKMKVICTKLLIGADGIWSAVRKQMVGDSPRYLDMVDWNALLYNPDLKIYHGISEGEVIVRSEENGPHSIIAHAGDYTLWILRKRDDSGELANTLLGGKSGGLGMPGCKARALQQLEGHQGWDILREAIEASSEEIISERKIMDRLPLDKWSDADGHVVLIGDAAHAQYVGPGQGGRTAFEDAHQLSLLLEVASLKSFLEESIEDAVKRFEAMRIPRMKKMQQYAAYSTGLSKFQPERFQKLTMEERRRMGQEYMKWVHAYPEKQEADPESFYFK
uniref:FAD-binding domain-containing protein n=1 Tax=Araucaria cunninghamii TaxID=56994 RepID=A0A0D6QR73_ARACU